MDQHRARAAVVVASLSVALSACGVVVTTHHPSPSASAPTSTSPSPEPSLKDQALLAEPSVVRVTESLCNDGGATGSGFLLDARHVVTVAHVVNGSTWTVVRGPDARLAVATVLGRDDKNEVALLELDRDLSTKKGLAFASKPAAQLDDVAAIGYAAGGAQTATTGQVEATGVRAQLAHGLTLKGLIQFSAPVSEGNSGGPVIDTDGNVVGLVEGENTAGNSIYFAIPADVAQRLTARWLDAPDPPADPTCPDQPSLVTVKSRLPDARSLATTFEAYFYGLSVKSGSVQLQDGRTETGYELAASQLAEDLAAKYPTAASLEDVYAGTTLSHVDLEKADTNGQLEDWADVSWDHEQNGTCERHRARFTLRLDSGWWKLSHRHNYPNPTGGCKG